MPRDKTAGRYRSILHRTENSIDRTGITAKFYSQSSKLINILHKRV